MGVVVGHSHLITRTVNWSYKQQPNQKVTVNFFIVAIHNMACKSEIDILHIGSTLC